MNKYDTINTISYMGNKSKLLDFIIPEIKKITKKGNIICDLFGGTNAIGYALKKDYTIYTNDAMTFSFIISKAIIENNNKAINKNSAKNFIKPKYEYNMMNKEHTFFYEKYKNKYFSEEQCLQIDSIRSSISNMTDIYEKALYLTALLNTVSRCQTTYGNFTHTIKENIEKKERLYEKDIWKEFLSNCNLYDDIIKSNYSNKSFNKDYKNLLLTKEFENVSCVYIDPPYSKEQYSRFYHVLEDLINYDNSNLKDQTKNNIDRFISNFSIKNKVKDEFIYLISTLSSQNKKVVLSYTTHGLLNNLELEEIFTKYYKHVSILGTKVIHSSFGSKPYELEELLYIAYN